jgi:hypothetical protein
MRHSDLNAILTLVDKLTMPHIVEHEIDEGSKLIRRKVQQDALLDQLDELIASSSGSAPGGGALSSERNLLNTVALELRDGVALIVKGMYSKVTAARPFPTVKQNLRQWFIEYRLQHSKGKISTERLRSDLYTLQKLVNTIEAKLNPPTVLEITAPCPRCKGDYGYDDEGVYRRAVIVESRVHAERSLENTRAKCVKCGAVWVHGNGMRQLRYEIDMVEAGRDTPDSIEHIFESSSTLDSAAIQVRPNEGASQ